MAAITFDRCVIHVFDWNHSIAFYRDALEAEVVPYGPVQCSSSDWFSSIPTAPNRSGWRGHGCP